MNKGKELKDNVLDKVTGGRNDNRETRKCPHCGKRYSCLKYKVLTLTCIKCGREISI